MWVDANADADASVEDAPSPSRTEAHPNDPLTTTPNAIQTQPLARIRHLPRVPPHLQDTLTRMRAETVHRRRATIAAAIRLLGVAMIAGGLFLIIQRLIFSWGTGDWTFLFRVWNGIGHWNAMPNGLALLAIGAALAGLASIISRWAVRPPAEGCPRCDHADAETIRDTGRCTECGYKSNA
ncbi:MAG: hypothetical protein AAGK04_02415 [Planctomycetota bacterium]